MFRWDRKPDRLSGLSFLLPLEHLNYIDCMSTSPKPVFIWPPLPVLSPFIAIATGIVLAACDAEVLAALMLGGGLVGVGVLLGQIRDRARIWMRSESETK